MKILLGGSPCTYWSIAQKNNRETEASGVGWELFKNYLIAKEKFKPDYFLYENNVSAAQPIKDQIKRELNVWDGTFLMPYTDVRYIEINSALVSAQNRERFYVHNCGEVRLPKDRGILLRDVLENGLTDKDKAYCLRSKAGNTRDYFKKHHTQVAYEPCIFQQGHGYNDGGIKYGKCPTITKSPSGYYGNGVVEPIQIGVIPTLRVNEATQKGYAEIMEGECVDLTQPNSKTRRGRSMSDKSNCLTTTNEFYQYCGTIKRPIYEVKDGKITIKGKEYPIKLIDGFYIIRKLTVAECRRLQTVPDWYQMPCSDTQNYKMLGNGWTIEVIKHILSHIPGIVSGEPIEVLSMYDGMSCGQIALKELGANVVKYYATEIDKYAIQTTQANFPDTIQLGDAFQVRDEDWKIGD